jgi:RNA polymerase sigma-70 factor (ECF subfamily)
MPAFMTSVEGALREDVLPGDGAGVRPLDLAAVHAEHADFVWATLQRFGIRAPDLEDAFQDVFIVVQRRVGEHDGASPLTTWLFAVCRRVAAAHRRKAHHRREQLEDEMAEIADAASDPEAIAAAREARARLERILDGMDLDRRAVFVMFEIEEIPCAEIAALVGAPVGTVYSRLHAARKEFARLLEKDQARLGREARRGGR